MTTYPAQITFHSCQNACGDGIYKEEPEDPSDPETPTRFFLSMDGYEPPDINFCPWCGTQCTNIGDWKELK